MLARRRRGLQSVRASASRRTEEEPEALSVTRWTGEDGAVCRVSAACGRWHVAFRDSPHAARLLQGADRGTTSKCACKAALASRKCSVSMRRLVRASSASTSSPHSRETRARHRAEGQGLSDEHRVGEVDVYPNAEAARAATGGAGEDAPGISFLKEQQWSLDFGTAVVKEQAVRESIRVPARLEARPGGAADVVAPIDGRLTRVVDVPLGASVSRGQELARLLPRLRAGRPSAAPARAAEAQTALALATRDRERAERLTSAGAAPAKRLDEARSAEEQAKARLAAAEASLAQYNAARPAATRTPRARSSFGRRSSGVIAQRDAATGANVAAGTVLFRVVDASQVHVVGQVPEAEAARATCARAAEIEIAGQPDRACPAGRLVSIGKVLDPQSRTLPITFALDNRTLGLPVGQAVVPAPADGHHAAAARRSGGGSRGRCRTSDRVRAARGRDVRAPRRSRSGREAATRADHRGGVKAGRSRRHERRLSRAARVAVHLGARAWARALSATHGR